MDDVKHERKVMDDLYNYLYSKNHPISYQYRMVVTPQFEQHPCCFNLLGHILHLKAFLPPPPKGLVELLQFFRHPFEEQTIVRIAFALVLSFWFPFAHSQ